MIRQIDKSNSGLITKMCHLVGKKYWERERERDEDRKKTTIDKLKPANRTIIIYEFQKFWIKTLSECKKNNNMPTTKFIISN